MDTICFASDGVYKFITNHVIDEAWANTYRQLNISLRNMQPTNDSTIMRNVLDML